MSALDHCAAVSVSGAALNGAKLAEAKAAASTRNDIFSPPSASKATTGAPTSAGASEAIERLALKTPAEVAVKD